MGLVQHRVNTLEQLALVPKEFGCEVDLRTNGKEIILNHDPYLPGDRLEDYLTVWAAQNRQGLLILNTKEDGLENDVLKMLDRYRIQNYFFLDTAMPTLIRKSKTPIKFAVRFSEFEPIELVKKFVDRCEWVWIDSFEGVPYETDTLIELGIHFKTCVVSPELHGYDRKRIQLFKPTVGHYQAICTKYPEDWQ